MKGCCNNDMNTDRGDFHISVCVIGLSESPKIVIFARSFPITRMTENSSIISDRVFFIFINTLYLVLKIININHNLHYTNSTNVVINFLTSPTA